MKRTPAYVGHVGEGDHAVQEGTDVEVDVAGVEQQVVVAVEQG
jgi:hypothetical protein